MSEKLSFEIEAQKGELGDPWSKLNEHHSGKVEPFLHILMNEEVKILALYIFIIFFCEPYHRRKLKFSMEFEDFKGIFLPSRSTRSISINPIVLYIVVFDIFPTNHYCLVRVNTLVYICTTFTAHLVGRIEPKVQTCSSPLFPTLWT